MLKIAEVPIILYRKYNFNFIVKTEKIQKYDSYSIF